jgi:hypothetical protein
MFENNMIVTVQQESLVTATSNLAAPTVVESMSIIGDVDLTTNGKVNGSILIYKTNTNKWTASTTLDAQNMDGGEF